MGVIPESNSKKTQLAIFRSIYEKEGSSVWITNEVVENLVTKFGFALSFYEDKDSNFSSKFSTDMCELLRIEKTSTNLFIRMEMRR